MTLTIAFRNIFRNVRRSLVTALTIAVGAAALLLFAAYALYDVDILETTAIQRGGHLTVFAKGYSDFGSADPAQWGIAGYAEAIRLVGDDPVLKPMLAVITPVQYLSGIAENPADGRSRTFFGTGFVAADQRRLAQWNGFGVGGDSATDGGLGAAGENAGVIGLGFARMLGLCGPLKLANCPAPPQRPTPDADVAGLPAQDFSAVADTGGATRTASVDLLAATAGGAPNIVRLAIDHVERQGAKEMDDGYVMMHLALAQQLVYGRGPKRVTGIVLQLHRSEDLPAARARVAALLAHRRPDLELRDYREINTYLGQTLGFFASLFAFIAAIIGVVVLFTVANTMGMSVMERTNEIGTSRALGVRRGRIRLQFLAEGAILGVLGASLGILLALAVAALINGAGLTWTPPGDAHPIPLKLQMLGAPGAVFAVWAILIAVAIVAALVPANRAARLPIVDALRHV